MNCSVSDEPPAQAGPTLGKSTAALVSALVLQPDASGGKDALVVSLNPDANYATFSRVGAAAWTWSGQPGLQRGFLAFDLGQVPSGATIQKATLRLSGIPSAHAVLGLSTLSGSNAAFVRRVTSPWSEDTITWNNQPSTTTDDQALLPASTSTTQTYEVDVTELVRDMMGPGQNHGFAIQLQNEQFYRAMQFASSDDGNADARPALEVQYETCDAIADSDHQKYWYYRARLVNDFVKVGDGQGHSLPASLRGAGGMLRYGDTTIDLGWYIGVLATEYRLVVDNGGDPSQTLRELYYALRAFNRLDELGEQHWGGQPNLNGWFIRDDVSGSWLSDPAVLAHFNSGKFGSLPVNHVVGDLALNPNTPGDESHDQAWHLMMGMGLVARFVDPNATYNGTSLVQAARDITTRIITYMRDGDWVIRNPVTGECRSCRAGDGCGIGNPCGANAVTLSYGAATAACKIVHGFGTPGLCNFHNSTSMNNAATWNAATLLPPIEEDWKFQLLATIGSSWSVDTLSRRAERRRFEVLPLMHEAIFGPPSGISDSTYSCLVSSAPCEGPYNLSSGGARDYPTYEWSTTSRAYHPLRRGDTDPDFPGEYNGLDYMMLYNLTRLTSGQATPGYDACHVKDAAPTSCSAPALDQDICTPVKADHAICTYGTECMSGRCGGCIIDGVGFCYQDDIKQLGESCVADRECRSERCSADCVLNPVGRCLCNANADCAAGEFCGWGLNDGICMKKRADHTLCSQDDECQSGHCGGFIGGTGWCYTPGSKTVGQGCRVNGECSTNRCLDLAQVCGCNSDSDCGGNQYCGWGLNAGRCQNKKGRGSLCASDRECASGSCRNLLRTCK